jgi:acetyl esterase/lipase
MTPHLSKTPSWLLWPGPSLSSVEVSDSTFQGDDVSDVHRPHVLAFVPDQPNGRAALVLAGGGYTKLVVSYEGVDVCRWLNSLGFHAFLLVHRFPQARWATAAQNGSQAPVDDAIEALRQIRARANEFGLRPDAIGTLGLSSGGHLAACLASNYPTTWTPPASPHAQISSRPDFLVVGYAPISTNATGRTVVANKAPLPPPEKQALYEAMQPDVQLMDHPPPTFIVYSAEDAVVPVENAYRLAAALRAKGASVETHVYAQGAHGFALRETALPVGQWPQTCAAWLTQLANTQRANT